MVVTPFFTCSIRLCLYFIPVTSHSASFCRKISVCLSHLVPEILGPKAGLIFTKMYYLIVFRHFISISSLIFEPVDPLSH